jgi:uncharacterized membrane protein YqaE (UPF0057 family)/ribosomal protein L7/L12
LEELKGEIPPEELEKYEERKSAEGRLKLLAVLLPPLSVLLCGKHWAALLNLFLLWPLGIVPGVVHAYWIVNRHTMTFGLDEEIFDEVPERGSETGRVAGRAANEAAAVEREIKTHLREGLKIQAIKRVNEATGWGLRDSRDYVDALVEGQADFHRLRVALPGVGGAVQVGAGEERAIPQNVRQAVLDRDAYICRYCGQRSQTMEVDHVVPVSEGGLSTLDNLVTACRDCNRRKGGRTPADAGMKVLPVRSQVRNG